MYAVNNIVFRDGFLHKQEERDFFIKRKIGKQSSVDGLESGNAIKSIEHLVQCCLTGLRGW